MRFKLFVVSPRTVISEEQLSKGNEEDNHCGHKEGHAPRCFFVGDGPEAIPDAHHKDLPQMDMTALDGGWGKVNGKERRFKEMVISYRDTK